jgi:hypothetical protein
MIRYQRRKTMKTNKTIRNLAAAFGILGAVLTPACKEKPVEIAKGANNISSNGVNVNFDFTPAEKAAIAAMKSGDCAVSVEAINKVGTNRSPVKIFHTNVPDEKPATNSAVDLMKTGREREVWTLPENEEAHRYQRVLTSYIAAHPDSEKDFEKLGVEVIKIRLGSPTYATARTVTLSPTNPPFLMER